LSREKRPGSISGQNWAITDSALSFQAARTFGKAAPRLAASLEEAVRDADAILLVTRWSDFGDLPRLVAARGGPPPLLVDGRRMIDPHAVPWYRGSASTSALYRHLAARYRRIERVRCARFLNERNMVQMSQVLRSQLVSSV